MRELAKNVVTVIHANMNLENFKKSKNWSLGMKITPIPFEQALLKVVEDSS